MGGDSVVLLDGEEVFALQCAVFWQVCAVDCVSTPIQTVSCSQCVRSEILGDFWVHRSNQITEGFDSILLAYLHHDDRSSGHLLSHLRELRQHTLVNLQELLSCRPVQVEHLHGRDFESLVQDGVDDLSGVACLDGVRLDDCAGAVSHHG